MSARLSRLEVCSSNFLADPFRTLENPLLCVSLSQPNDDNDDTRPTTTYRRKEVKVRTLCWSGVCSKTLRTVCNIPHIARTLQDHTMESAKVKKAKLTSASFSIDGCPQIRRRAPEEEAERYPPLPASRSLLGGTMNNFLLLPVCVLPVELC